MDWEALKVSIITIIIMVPVNLWITSGMTEEMLRTGKSTTSLLKLIIVILAIVVIGLAYTLWKTA